MEGGYSDPIGRGLVSLTSAQRIPDHGNYAALDYPYDLYIISIIELFTSSFVNVFNSSSPHLLC